MTNPNLCPPTPEPLPTTDMDTYFETLARGAAYCARLAIQQWNTMTPSEQRDLQKITREFAGDDMALGQDFARSQLIFSRITSHAAQPDVQHVPS